MQKKRIAFFFTFNICHRLADICRQPVIVWLKFAGSLSLSGLTRQPFPTAEELFMNDTLDLIDKHNFDHRPTPTARLDPCFDSNFKNLFTQGTEASTLALKDFISTLLGHDVKNLQLRPNEPPKDSVKQMQMSFDVSVEFADGEKADLEMQSRLLDYDYGSRSEIQAARLLNNNAKTGSNWNVPKVYQISVLNFEFDKDDNEVLAWYTMKNQNNITLAGRLNILYFDLVKLRRQVRNKAVRKMTKLEKWGLYFSYADDESRQNLIKQIVKSEAGIMAADTILTNMSENDDNWALQFSLWKARLDYNTPIENAHKRGFSEAIEQTTTNLLKMHKLTNEQIAQVTGLPLEKVLELEKSLKK